MILLLLEGLLSYLVTTFAHLCKLQPPCPMCTRLDHVLGKAQPGFYRDLMCSSHKAEASSWAFCHIHQKLVDVHSMCEACLLSFATDKKSNLETYWSLVGKIGSGIDNVVCRDNFNYRIDAPEAPAMKKDTLCSCCLKPLELKSYPFVLQRKANGTCIEENFGDGLGDQCMDGIDYIVYSELKTSDSESDPWQLGVGSLLKDDDNNLKEDFTSGHPQTKVADLILPYDNSQERVPEQSEMVLVQSGGSDNNKPSENSGQLFNVQVDSEENLQSAHLPRKDGRQTTGDSNNKGDNLEDDVWQNAISCTEELSVAAKSAGPDARANEKKAEFTHGATGKNSFKVHEDLKLLLSQLSSTPHAPDTDSPSIQDQRKQAILHNITRAISLERNHSGISDSMVDESEGECTIDQLKKQVELDRQSISRLWKELEEERNASAVATNQTMAMITRLQEEKAAMQMEALQYQRMLEEQSEYDREDLQRMAETVQELQAELESCKVKLRDQLIVEEIRDHMRLSSCPKDHEPTIPKATESLSGFEEEKAYVSKRLRKLRQKLHQFSNNSKHIPLPKFGDDKEDSGDESDAEDVDEDSGQTDTSLAFDEHLGRNGGRFKDSTIYKGRPKGQYRAMVCENDPASFEDKISEVSGRLRALEADRSFLEHSVNSLRNGEAGEELIRDIAGSLRELRKTGIAWKEYE